MQQSIPSAADPDDFVSASEMDEFLRRPYESDEPDAVPYCSTCGATIGHFLGHGDNWHHFKGEGTTENPTELYDAGHEPVVAWREPSPTAAEGTVILSAAALARLAAVAADL